MFSFLPPGEGLSIDRGRGLATKYFSYPQNVIKGNRHGPRQVKNRIYGRIRFDCLAKETMDLWAFLWPIYSDYGIYPGLPLGRKFPSKRKSGQLEGKKKEMKI